MNKQTKKQGEMKRIEIAPGIELIDHALWIPEQKLLAISDTHIGYEEALNKKGILVPRFGFDEMRERMKKIITAVTKTRPYLIGSPYPRAKARGFTGSHKWGRVFGIENLARALKCGVLYPKKISNARFSIKKGGEKGGEIQTILVNGDLKHEFGTISDQEWRETLQFLDLLLAHAPNIVIVKGNHDTIIGPIARKRNVNLVDHFMGGNILFIHGNVIPDDFEKITKQHHTKTIVIGNEHPAITIGTRLRREKYKCFLKGTYHGKRLIVLPSFNTLAEGTDVTHGRILSPFIQKPKECEVWVIDEQNNTHRYFGMARAASSTQTVY